MDAFVRLLSTVAEALGVVAGIATAVKTCVEAILALLRSVAVQLA
jgi:hypothetical protein